MYTRTYPRLANHAVTYFRIYVGFAKELSLNSQKGNSGYTQWLPLSVTPSHQPVLTRWKKSLKNQGVFNTLNNSITPHFDIYNTSGTPLKISPTLRKILTLFHLKYAFEMVQLNIV